MVEHLADADSNWRDQNECDARIESKLDCKLEASIESKLEARLLQKLEQKLEARLLEQERERDQLITAVERLGFDLQRSVLAHWQEQNEGATRRLKERLTEIEGALGRIEAQRTPEQRKFEELSAKVDALSALETTAARALPKNASDEPDRSQFTQRLGQLERGLADELQAIGRGLADNRAQAEARERERERAIAALRRDVDHCAAMAEDSSRCSSAIQDDLEPRVAMLESQQQQTDVLVSRLDCAAKDGARRAGRLEVELLEVEEEARAAREVAARAADSVARLSDSEARARAEAAARIDVLEAVCLQASERAEKAAAVVEARVEHVTAALRAGARAVRSPSEEQVAQPGSGLPRRPSPPVEIAGSRLEGLEVRLRLLEEELGGLRLSWGAISSLQTLQSDFCNSKALISLLQSQAAGTASAVGALRTSHAELAQRLRTVDEAMAALAVSAASAERAAAVQIKAAQERLSRQRREDDGEASGTPRDARSGLRRRRRPSSSGGTPRTSSASPAPLRPCASEDELFELEELELRVVGLEGQLAHIDGRIAKD
eukprot:tig00001085_g6951.t1